MKEAVFPFIKFPGVDTILGPEMKSTGEVMGVGETFAEAFVKDVYKRQAFSFQGHPEASPGPTEMSYLFDRFISMMQASKTAERKAS